MSTESLKLRALAQAIEDLEAMEKAERPPNLGAVVSWSFGSACPGYKEMSKAVSQAVDELMPTLFDEALARQRAKVALLRSQMAD